MTRGVWFGIALVFAASTAQAQDMMRGDDRMGGRGMSGVGLGAGIAAGVITGILANQPKQGASAQPASGKGSSTTKGKKAAKKPVPQDQPQQGGGTPPVANKPPPDGPPPAPGGDIVKQDGPSVPVDGTPPTPPSTTTDGGGTTPKPEDPTDLPKKPPVTIATKPGEPVCCSCVKSLTLKLNSESITLPPGKKKGDPNADDEAAQADTVLPSRKVNGHMFNVRITFFTKKSDTPGPLTLEWEETMDRPNDFYRLVGVRPDVPANLVTAFGDSTERAPGHPNSTVRDLVRHLGEFEHVDAETTLTKWFTSYLGKKANACPVAEDTVQLDDAPWAASPRRLFFRIKVTNPPNCGCPPTGKASVPPAPAADTQSLELKAAQILWPLWPGNTDRYPVGKTEVANTWVEAVSQFYGPQGQMPDHGRIINGVPAPAPDAAVPHDPPPKLRNPPRNAGR